MKVLRRWSCRLGGGHLPVTRFHSGQMRVRCYVCDAPLSRGWDFADLQRKARYRQQLPPLRSVLRGVFQRWAA